jgi:hypothetical protein
MQIQKAFSSHRKPDPATVPAGIQHARQAALRRGDGDLASRMLAFRQLRDPASFPTSRSP